MSQTLKVRLAHEYFVTSGDSCDEYFVPMDCFVVFTAEQDDVFVSKI